MQVTATDAGIPPRMGFTSVKLVFVENSLPQVFFSKSFYNFEVWLTADVGEYVGDVDAYSQVNGNKA